MSLPKIKLLRRFYCLKTRFDPDCSSPTKKKHTQCKDTKVKRRGPLTMFRFYPYCVHFHQAACLLSAGLEDFRSNLVFEILNNLIFGIIYWCVIGAECLKSSLCFELQSKGKLALSGLVDHGRDVSTFIDQANHYGRFARKYR